MSNFIKVSNTNQTLNLGDIHNVAADPAARVNQLSTQIDPGRILISGGTSLASWRNGGDTTKIEGGSIAANTISANKLTIGNRGITFAGLNFEWNPANDSVFWTGGYVTFIDDNNNTTTQQISAGATTTRGVAYWQRGTNTVQWSGNWEIGTRDDTVRLAWWVGGSTLVVDYGGTIINGDRITTGTIDANRIKANTILASSVVIGGVSGANTVADAFKRADYSTVTGAGKPETYTVMARGNQTSQLPANYAHGMRDANGAIFQDLLGGDLRSDMYSRSYTLLWRIHSGYWAIRSYDVYSGSRIATDDAGDSGAAAMATRLNSIAPGTPVVIYTSDEPNQNHFNSGLPEAMYRCGASRTVFGSPNWTGWDSYVLIGTAGIGEGNGIEKYKAGGADSFVQASFSIVNGVVQASGKSIKDASELRFTGGRVVQDLAGVQAGATVGAPAGTMIGNTEAQTVTNWAYTGQQDPAARINSGGATVDASRLTFAGGRVVQDLAGVQAGATVGAPAGTYIGNTEAQTVTNWAYAGQRDPADRINNGETTTINGGRITTGSVTANQIAAYTIGAGQIAAGSITADRLNVGSLSAVSANIGNLVSYNGQGGRVERDGNGTRVYGNNGVLRVKIGF